MSKISLLVDSISLLSKLSGIGRYTYEISKIIKERNEYEVMFFYGYFSRNLINPKDFKGLKSSKNIIERIPFLKKIVRECLFKISPLFSKKYDFYWQPNFIPNLNIKAKKIITSVHDFSFILHKEFHPKERIEYFEKYFYVNIKKSDLIITGSEFSKQEILDKLDFKDQEVKVIYHGIDHEIFKIHTNLSVDFNLPEKFIFSVGSIEPRKNLIGLLNAYNLLPENIKKEYKLVLAGFKGWENKEIMNQIEQNKENIFYLGYLLDEELAKVYNRATCFVFPSFYEGFGLPILESMACGTPVVCSDTTSLPEVGGDAVSYCNPYDIKDIAIKIEMILEDKILQEVMIQKGLSRAKLFSWEKSANEHINFFNEIIKT